MIKVMDGIIIMQLSNSLEKIVKAIRIYTL
jgi:hypothetical protein